MAPAGHDHDDDDSIGVGIQATVTDPVAELAPPRAAPRRVGRYELGEILGEGGMGVVHRAHDPHLNRAVAVKLVRRGSRGVERFFREAQAMARLRHPNVLPVFDVGTHAGQMFVVMPLVEGGTLRGWMAQRRPWREVVAHLISAGRGLAAAHTAGLVHRDFKPDNVLLGDRGEVLVADFGLVRAVGEADAAGGGADAPSPALTHDGAVMGTPAYMAPEQLDGAPVDARADQFAFCVVLYEALLGRRPFDTPGERPTLASLRDAIRRGPPAAEPTAVPPWLVEAIARGLSEDPARRWPSMDALLAALERGLRRGRRVWAGAIGGGLTIAAVAVVAIAARRDPPALPPAAPAPVDAAWVETPLTARGDVSLAVASPDGARVAIVADDELLVVPTAGGEPRRLLRPLGAFPQLSWPADGRLGVASGVPGVDRTLQVLDVATGEVIESLPLTGGGAATLLDERTEVRWQAPRPLEIRSSGEPPRTCRMPDDVQWTVDVAGMAGRIYATVKYPDGRHGLVVTDRSCAAVRTVVGPSDAERFWPRADGSVVAMERGAPANVAVEYDAAGDVIRRRPLPVGTEIAAALPGGELVLARVTHTWKLFEPGAGTLPLASGAGFATGDVDAAGARLAVVERGSDAGVRIVTLATGDRASPVIPGARAAAWSPDDARLAVIAAGPPPALVVLDAAGGELDRRGVPDASPFGELAWLDDTRVAYLRRDHRTYRWLDLRDGSTGDLFDPRLGWTFRLDVSDAGDLAISWNRRDRGVWIVRAGGAASRLRERDLWRPAWAPDGESVWLARADAEPGSRDRGRIDRVDARTGEPLDTVTVDLAPLDEIAGLYALADGRLLALVNQGTRDLVHYGPAREPPAQ